MRARPLSEGITVDQCSLHEALQVGAEETDLTLGHYSYGLTFLVKRIH